MKILFIGDIVGRPGRTAVKELLPNLKTELNIDLVIANVENLVHGKGIAKEKLQEMQKAGVNLFTGGNHSFAKPEFWEVDYLKFDIVRPANFPLETKGNGYLIYQIGDFKILLINLQGQIYMNHQLQNPLIVIDEILTKFKDETFDSIIVDFHAEATAEKYALRHYLDGKINMLVGTHTHIPTADAHVTKKNMAYITDVGMTGAVDSCLGVKAESIIEKSLTQMNVKQILEDQKPYYLRAVLVEIIEKKAVSIQLIQTKLN